MGRSWSSGGVRWGARMTSGCSVIPLGFLRHPQVLESCWAGGKATAARGPFFCPAPRLQVSPTSLRLVPQSACLSALNTLLSWQPVCQGWIWPSSLFRLPLMATACLSTRGGGAGGVGVASSHLLFPLVPSPSRQLPLRGCQHPGPTQNCLPSRGLGMWTRPVCVAACSRCSLINACQSPASE